MCMNTDSARFYCISFVAVSQDERSAARRRPVLLSATLKISYIRGCSIYKKKQALFCLWNINKIYRLFQRKYEKRKRIHYIVWSLDVSVPNSVYPMLQSELELPGV